jgi:uncharacterized protein YggE
MNIFHRSLASCLLVLLIMPRAHAQPQPQPPAAPRAGPPTLTVTGEGESAARPDRAVVRLGAAAQGETASAAQEQVNQVMQAAIDAIRAAGIKDEMISTAGLSLYPVYSDQAPRPMPGGQQQRPSEPRIVAYRAGNSVRVVVDDLAKVGDVIDDGVKAGANQIEELTFQLKDDTAARREALTGASKQARAKADAIAQAMGLRIDGVVEVTEGGVQIMRPRMEMARGGAVAAMEAATPVQPGQVDVHATVTVTYRVSPADGAAER